MITINILKNNLYRIIAQKASVIVAVVVVPVMIAIAILFSQNMDKKAEIALVTNNPHNVTKSDKLKIDVMNEKPAYSKLLLGKYAAIVEEKKAGTYDITMIKNQEDKEVVENFFKYGKLIESSNSKAMKRGTGTNIIGYILMIILMQAVSLITLYPEDRTLKTFRRVLTAPISEGLYIFAQEIFTFLGVYIPTFIAVAVVKECFGVDIDFSLGLLAILLAILSAFSTAFAIFMASVLDRDISLVSSGIIVITSVLAGCFYSFTDGSKILDAACSILPQKEYMTMIQGIENGSGLLQFKGQLIYLLIWIIVLWFLGSIITKTKIKRGIY